MALTTKNAKRKVDEVASAAAEATKDGIDAIDQGVSTAKTAARRQTNRARKAIAVKTEKAEDALVRSGAKLAARLNQSVDRERAPHIAERLGNQVAQASDKAEQTAVAIGQRVSDVGHRVSDGLNTAAETLRTGNLRDVAAEVGAAAKRHPGLFAAGAALAGFALARLITPRGGRDA